MIKGKLYGALKISVIYFFTGCIWIISSDKILEILIPGKEEYADFQTYKGWIFILTSAILLFILLYNELKKRDVIEADLNKNIDEKRVLLNEVHHRVKNNLNSIISFLYLENSKAESPESAAIIEALSGRIYSMSLVHEHLYKSENFINISLKKYIPGLVSYIKGMYPIKEKNIKLFYNIDDTVLDITKAIPFGILLNEIVSNSYKHAFPGQTEGGIFIEVKTINNECITEVGDDGIGIPDMSEINSARGHGIELMELLVKQLSGVCTMSGDCGLKYRIVFQAAG
jgi:two-component sensor histidine kinase